MTLLIAITGGSGSGKSTLAEAVVAALPERAAVLLREDAYYRDAASLPDFDATITAVSPERAAELDRLATEWGLGASMDRVRAALDGLAGAARS